MMLRRFVWLACLIASPAAAQPGEAVVHDMAGPWIVLPADGRPGCPVTLTDRSMGDRWRASADPVCAQKLPALRGLAAWKLEGGAELADAKGKTLMMFEEDETAVLTSPNLQQPQYYLVPAIPGYTHIPQPAELAGKWSVGLRGKVRCSVTLAAAEKLVPDKACAGSVFAKLSRWSRENTGLLFWGANDQLVRFEPSGAASFKAEEGGWTLAR